MGSYKKRFIRFKGENQSHNGGIKCLKKYDKKPTRPFEIWNIGNYETAYWQEKQNEYLAFMLKLYQAQFLTRFRCLHGRKGDRAVHVGPLNAPVTMEEVEKGLLNVSLIISIKQMFLAVEWSYEVNEQVAYLEIDTNTKI